MTSGSFITPDGPARTVDRCPLMSQKLRDARTARDLTLRLLAKRIGVSASLISQIETGKVQPSVNTLYALANELDLSLDELLFPESPDMDSGSADRDLALPQIVRAATRTTIEVDDRVRWERLTDECEPGFDFLEIVYDPGGESGPPGRIHRHAGREWGVVLTGTLHVELGPDSHVLGPGDSISFASTTPHRLHNPGSEPVRGIWFVLGRTDDPRPEPSG